MSLAPSDTAAGSVVVRWYGPLLAVVSVALALASYGLDYRPDTNARLWLSIPIAILLLIGGERFIIALPFNWGTAQVSVGAICALGVAIWLGPVYATILIALISFQASYLKWKHWGLSLENAASASVSAAITGMCWWSLVAEGVNPLTSARTSAIFLAIAVLHSVINFGTVVAGAALVRREPLGRLIVTMSGGKNFFFSIPVLAAFIPLIGSQSPIALLFFAVPLVSSHLALRALWRLESDTQKTLAALTDILELRDSYTAFHSERVSLYALAIARNVPGYGTRELATLERAARIHDIGKAAVRDAVLLKNGKLSDEERTQMEAHSAVGAQLIDKMHAYRDCVELIRHHHERWDGAGYPARLSGEQIPLGARIMAVADSLDAMTTDRPYRKALTFDEAMSEIRRNSERQYDPVVVKAFFDALDDPAFKALAEQSRSRLAAD